MNISCTAEVCPVILNATCVFYEGSNLIYTGIVTNDNLQTAIQKIDAKFQDAGLGYVFTNGLIQENPGDPVKLGGSLLSNTLIEGNYTLSLEGQLEASKLITTGGNSSQFLKGDGSLDGNAYQLTGNYLTALTGDGTASGPGSASFTLANTGVIASTYGSTTRTPVITVDAKGRVTNLTTVVTAIPSSLIIFAGDVYGAGHTGSTTTLTLETVNANIYSSLTPLKLTVNAKGLVTSAAPITTGDILGLIGYTPVPNTRTLTINGVTHDLSANRTWTIPVGGIFSVTATPPLLSSGGANPNISVSPGYVIPTTTQESNWNIAYTNRITSLTTVGTSGVATLVSNVLNIPNYSTDITGLVPYTGAVADVNIGQHDLYTRVLKLYDAPAVGYGTFSLVDNIFKGLKVDGDPIYDIEQSLLTLYKSATIASTFTNVLLSASRLYNLPNAGGTIPLSVNGNTSDINGNITVSIPIVTPSALTKTDDTNVTLTLGGSPSTALLAATSLTLGWTGTLADSRITSASTWNAKQNAITLTTIGTSGAATFIANTLNIPQYQAVLTNPVTGTGVATRIAFWDGTSSISSNSNLYWDNVNNRLGIGNILPIAPIDLGDITGTAGSISKIALYSHPSYGTYGLGVSAGQLDYVSGGSHVFYSNSPSTSELFRIGGTGTLTASSLTGSGTRMVVSNSIGELSTQTIPSFTSPLTTKGDIYVRDASTDTRLPVGLDTQILLADSTQPTGLKWGTNTAATPLGYYAAFSDVINQTAAVINTGYPMLLGITDLSNGISVVSGSRVTIANTGIYNIQWSAQFTNPTAADHDVTIWLRKNGVDVPGSAGVVLVPAKHGASDGHILPSWNFLLDVVGGDYYEFVWSTENTSVYISFQPAGSPPPSTASVVLTVTQQSGIMAGTGMTALNGLTGAVQTLAIGTSGISPAFTSVGTTHTLDIPLASGTGVTAGLLSNTDYNNFGTRAAGGSFVSYYFNGGVAASVATYYQMSPSANIAAAANFTLAGNGLISQWLSDVGNPNRLEIPAGNWNFEMYMSASSAGGTPAFYIELLKYNGSTFTTIANSSAAPKNITGGTSIDLYLTSLAIPQTTLLVTDRLAIRVYIVNSIPGRSVTMYTQDSHVSEVITNFAGGISALNGLTVNTQYFATGTSGTDFNISSVSPTHTFNLPTASATNRGALSTTDWSTFNNKQSTISLTTTGSSGSSTFISNVLNIPTYTLSGLGGQPLATNLTSLSGLTYASTSFVKMTAAGTFALDTNTYQGTITLTTTGTSGAATLIANTLNIPNYVDTNIYNSDGTLTGARTITSNGNLLKILGGNINASVEYNALQVETPNTSDASIVTINLNSTSTTTPRNWKIRAIGGAAGGFDIFDQTSTYKPFEFLNSTLKSKVYRDFGNQLNDYTLGTAGITGVAGLWLYKATPSISNYSILADGNTTFINHNGGGIGFRESNADRMRLFVTTGNLLIQSGGTYSDRGYKLQVTGTAEATQFKISALNTAPASATATGVLGEVRITSGFIYVCIATNTWVRTILTTF